MAIGEESLYDRMMQAYNDFKRVGTVGGTRRLGESLGNLVPSGGLESGLDPTHLADRRMVTPARAAQDMGLLPVSRPPSTFPALPSVADLQQGARAMQAGSGAIQRGGTFGQAASAVDDDLPFSVSATKDLVVPDDMASSLMLQTKPDLGQGAPPPINPSVMMQSIIPGIHDAPSQPPKVAAPEQHFTPEMNEKWMRAIGMDPPAPNQFYGQTPLGPARGIATLRGNVPGFVSFYTPEQRAAQGAQGIALHGQGEGFEWGQGNTEAFINQMANRNQMALLATKAAQENENHDLLAQSRFMDAQAKLEAERAKYDPERLQVQRENFAAKADPDLLNPVRHPEFASKFGIPLSADQQIMADLHRQAIGSENPTMPSLQEAAKASISPEKLMSSSLGPEFLKAIQSMKSGYSPYGQGFLGWLSSLFSGDKHLGEMANISQGLSEVPEDERAFWQQAVNQQRK